MADKFKGKTVLIKGSKRGKSDVRRDKKRERNKLVATFALTLIL